jgi:hypothetical protein
MRIENLFRGCNVRGLEDLPELISSMVGLP